MPTLREFTEGHAPAARLAVDWAQVHETLPVAVADTVDPLEAMVRGEPDVAPAQRKAIEQDLRLW
jgi:hypothetical protein